MPPQREDDGRALADVHRQTAKRSLAEARFEDAVAHYDAYLALNPDDAGAHSNKANALIQLGRQDEALESYNAALALALAVPGHPHLASMHVNRGNLLFGLRRFEEALADYRSATAAAPNFAEAHAKTGLALHALRRSEAALAAFDDALRYAPGTFDIYYMRASVLYDLGRLQECVASYDAALDLRPDNAEAQRDRGFCLLASGDFVRGWLAYEARKRVKRPAGVSRSPQPEWTGAEDIAGKTVLISVEQGFGDTLQFARYVREVERRGAKVIFAVQEALRTLLQNLTPTVSVRSETSELPPFDFQIALLSLPLALGINSVADIDGAPYLALPSHIPTPRLPGAGLKVGLVWRGNPHHHNDDRRSFDLRELELLADVPGVDWFSLQVGVAQDGPFRGRWAGRLKRLALDAADFAVTAAAMSQVDLVITVDTAPAHLAGALGKPVWLLVSQGADWRWFLGRDDSPWYASMRLFRQEHPWNWSPTLARVAAELQRAVTERRPGENHES